MTLDPKDLFTTAEVFRASSVILQNLINRGMPQYTMPMIVCSAFSLELHLKCLILIEGDAARGHDLEQLFSILKPESQKIIRACYEKQHRPKMDAMFSAFQDVPAPKSDFDSAIHTSAKAFEHFRYAFEGIVKSGEGWMASPICECVRERVVALHPDWGNLTYGLNGPLMPQGM